MVGITSGTPDALMRFTRPLTGAFYMVPSSDALHRWVLPDPEDRPGDDIP